MSEGIPPWPLNPASLKGKIDEALQIQYMVYDPRDGFFQVQGINVFFRPPKLSGRSVTLPEALYHSVNLITKKQWLLQLFWEKEAVAGRLQPSELATLSWYILYYEAVLDSVIATQPIDYTLLHRWVKAEWFTPHIHVPPVERFLETKDLGEVEVERMVRRDLWKIKKHMHVLRLNDVNPQQLEENFAQLRFWLTHHDQVLSQFYFFHLLKPLTG